MKITQQSPRWRAFSGAGEKGFTLLEILVTLAVLGILIALLAAALLGRVDDTRVEAVASQVGQTIANQRQLYTADIRQGATGTANLNNRLTRAALQARLATVLQNVDEIASVLDAPTGTCANAGVMFTTQNALAGQGAVLEAAIGTQATAAFAGQATTGWGDGTYRNVFGVDATDFVAATRPAASARATVVNEAYLCIN